MKIALDAMGGDLAPRAVVEGAVLAARELGIEVVLVGDREIVARELANLKGERLPITIEHASQVVEMDDSPLESVMTKPNSSISAGFELVRRGDAQAFVSAGNSGAMMAAAILVLGTLPGVDRPAIASLIPSASGFTLLIDVGANTEVKPLNLVQFAVMGTVYTRRVRQIARPRVGILSNGEEDSKGTELTRAAAAMLRQMSADVDYVGYVEGRDINRGRVDVVVTDGFTGNVALKSLEGFSSFLLGNLRELFAGTVRGRIAYLFIGKFLSAMRNRLDPSEYGGAPLLGVSGVAVIAHGSSNPRAIRNAVRAAANEALINRVNAEIVELLSHGAAVAEKPAGKGLRAMLSRMRERLHRPHPQPHPQKEGDAPRHHKENETGRKGAAEAPPAAEPPPPAARGATGPLTAAPPAHPAANGAAPELEAHPAHHEPSPNGAAADKPKAKEPEERPGDQEDRPHSDKNNPA
ncbi:MAG TPA: phosphate acyltransferase PlsX [Candidatus Binataceae bacterium]|nr:phosphate acyltransferase PlsX [Candidatus Binataceae bacterium]